MSLGFLTARAWLDEDGRHVWLKHHCMGSWVETMLPWPTWSSADGVRVSPSINCRLCGLHYFAKIERTPHD